MPGVLHGAYAGDAGAVAAASEEQTAPTAAQKALRVTEEFATLTGQRVNPRKCYGWATTQPTSVM